MDNNIILADELKKCIIESLVDGEGVRLVIFTCGCPHHCKSCHNANTWNIDNGVGVDIESVAEYLKNKFYNGRFSGITLSGGDPLYQSESLLLLVKRIKDLIPEANIWCYTGYLYEDVKNLEVLKHIDVLVDGKFESDKKYPKKSFRGSYNQRIIRLRNNTIISIE